MWRAVLPCGEPFTPQGIKLASTVEMWYTYRMNNHKLTQEQITEIKTCRAAGASVNALAIRFGVDRTTIRWHAPNAGQPVVRQAPPIPKRKNPLPPPSISKPAAAVPPLPASSGALVGAIMEAPATPLPDGPAECPPQYLRPDGTSRVVCNNCHTNAARWYRIKGQMFARDCVECATRDKAYVDSKVGP